jgi:hypothetical protein
MRDVANRCRAARALSPQCGVHSLPDRWRNGQWGHRDSGPVPGFSVVEMLVTLTVSAIAITLVGAVGFRQQRFHRDVVAVTERLEQLDQATALIPIALRSIAPGEGDIPPGGARDTSLEFRATIATAVVCDSGHGSLVLAPPHTAPPRLASFLDRPAAGDTAWWLSSAGAGEVWSPRTITGVFDSTTTCFIGGVFPWANQVASPSVVLRVAAPLPPAKGLPIRITRSWKYSIYRASDGSWYLGARDWNSGTLRFNIIQPVSGPFVPAAAHGVAFRYYDSAGVVIASGSSNTRGIALIQVAFSVDSVIPGQFAHAIGIRGSTIASVALRNQQR